MLSLFAGLKQQLGGDDAAEQQVTVSLPVLAVCVLCELCAYGAHTPDSIAEGCVSVRRECTSWQSTDVSAGIHDGGWVMGSTAAVDGGNAQHIIDTAAAAAADDCTASCASNQVTSVHLTACGALYSSTQSNSTSIRLV